MNQGPAENVETRPAAEVYQLHTPMSSPIVSQGSSPPASLAAPASPGTDDSQAQKPALPVATYAGEAEHLARPTRRFQRVQIPDQTEGPMRGAAPGVGQALPKAAKVDANSIKARTLGNPTHRTEEANAAEEMRRMAEEDLLRNVV